jgi:hypothetical protein
MRFPRVLAVIAAAAALAAFAGPARAAAGPFTWDGATWCPSYWTWNGCTADVLPKGYSTTFDPAQVTAGADVTLAIDPAAARGAAIDTQGNTTWPIGSSWAQVITLPCDSSGRILNWPAFWTTHSSGSWPANGEIDIMEGLGGRASATVHYLNAQGVPSAITIYPPGDWCGTHEYAATWTASAVTFTWDGTQAGQVTAAQMGVPMFTDPQYLTDDYGAGKWGGPVQGGVSMTVAPAAGLFRDHIKVAA